MRAAAPRLAGVGLAIALAAGCGDDLVPSVATPVDAAPVPLDDGPHLLVGAGDIGGSWRTTDEATAALLDAIDGTVFTVGDNAYPRGSAADFAEGFHPSWGRHKARIRPAAGNHDYLTEGAAPYFDYFGDAAGEPSTGYYSYDLGAWHIVVLNTNHKCQRVACGVGSAQERWLRADLAATDRPCVAAIMHEPRFSSGRYAATFTAGALFEALAEHGVDLLVSGHEHHYERFAPLDAAGEPDPERGIVQLIVGTGGASLRPITDVHPGSLSRNDQDHGVLELTLWRGSYDWRFVPVAGGRFADAGSRACTPK